MKKLKNILITGGAGFIGSHLVKHLVDKYSDYNIINFDALTYAGNLESLAAITSPNYVFERGDIRNSGHLQKIFEKYDISDVIHLAAESHVDRSILNPMGFVETNVIGTVTLLNVAKEMWKDKHENTFYHVSTDEVYGSLGSDGYFTEDTAYDPRSPYSASKASSDHFVRAYHHTYGLKTVISNCSNNYGPFQFPEKLIPLMIHNIVSNKNLPVYGKGINVRDWIYVKDHVRAIDTIFHNGKSGETYNVGGNCEQMNIDVVHTLIKMVDKKLGREEGASTELIKFVKDRAGHDMRYAIDNSKILAELGWKPEVDWNQGISETVDWYLENAQWIEHIKSGEYKEYYQKQYAERS